MSGSAFEEVVEEHEVKGATIRIYGAAKCVADCFKYRNKIGIDVAIEALTDYRRSREYDANALWQFAKISRDWAVMRPYMEVAG
jgi:hypothetical protein